MSRRKLYTKEDKVWKSIKRNLRAQKSEVRIGWFAGNNYGSDNGNLPMAQVAQWVEEGQRWNNQPARPAIRTQFIPDLAGTGFIQRHAISMAQQVALGRITWRQGHQRLAPHLIYRFKLVLTHYHTIANRPSTIRRKGFDDPWIETGQLVQSVQYRIESVIKRK